MQTIAKWTATDYILFKSKHACPSVRMHWSAVFADMTARGAFRQYTERDAERFGKQILQQCNTSIRCPQCGEKFIRGEFILARDTGTVKVCNSKCMGATGPACDCPCQGENHGAKHHA